MIERVTKQTDSTGFIKFVDDDGDWDGVLTDIVPVFETTDQAWQVDELADEQLVF